MTAKPARPAVTPQAKVKRPAGAGKSRKGKRRGSPPARRHWGLRRRRVLINRLAQIRFIFKLLVQVGLFYLVLGLVVQRHVSGLLAMLKDIPASSDAAMSALTSAIIRMKNQFYVAAVALSILATIAVTAVGLFASQRLNGPILRLKRFLTEPFFAPGAEPIRFRRHDHLDDLAETLNRTRDVVGTRRQEIAAILDQLAAQARDLTRSETPETAQELFETMEENLRQLTARMETAAPVDSEGS